ncbi:MAG: TRAP transporter substrate-binding protein [Kiloniellales bacterium]|nr:TRAP transporter substrate-binding protein [Kiloniellales bacterium]MDJ0971669.1 TRAP transporter substrate-binding protein [Kiloniellales bacterium]MDJ0981177.1 TRAP transporter substrate-binding protein [Kiloniellales bacterium]
MFITKRAFSGALLGIAGVALAGFGGAAQAEEEIIFAISAKTGSLQQMTAAEFTKRANEKLAGKATVKLFDSAQLGKDKELMQKLKLGTVHIALPSSIMSSVADEFGLFDMPFLVKDRDHVARIEKDVFWPEIAPTAEAKGYQVLAVWENGVRHITNNKRPISTPADLDGIKLRTPKSKWRVKMFEAWGANPTPMAFSEVFVALQTGVIDGQENPYTNIWSAKFAEVQSYLSVTGHVYSPAYPTAGKAAFSQLDPEIQKVLKDTAGEMALWARGKGAEGDQSLKDKLVGAGMKLNEADRAAFVEASKPIYAQFSSEVPTGKALIDKALALAESP